MQLFFLLARWQKLILFYVVLFSSGKNKAISLQIELTLILYRLVDILLYSVSRQFFPILFKLSVYSLEFFFYLLLLKFCKILAFRTYVTHTVSLVSSYVKNLQCVRFHKKYNLLILM